MTSLTCWCCGRTATDDNRQEIPYTPQPGDPPEWKDKPRMSWGDIEGWAIGESGLAVCSSLSSRTPEDQGDERCRQMIPPRSRRS